MTRRPGWTLIELILVLAIISLLLGLILSAVQRVRSASQQAVCQNNLRQITVAMHGYHQSQRQLPAGMRRRHPHLFMAWSAQLLPHLEQSEAWSEAVKDYENQRLFSRPIPHRNLNRIMPGFICPSDGRPNGTTAENVTAAFTNYLGVSGDKQHRHNGVLFVDSKITLSEITDGSSQTLMIGERPPSEGHWFGWWYAGIGQNYDGVSDSVMDAHELNMTFRAPMCDLGPYRFQAGRADDRCSTFHFWSLHPGGAHFAFADGSVKFLRYSADAILPALATRAGGEVVAVPE